MNSSIIYKRKRALIIGINKYPCHPLHYCCNDATDLHTTLQHIGFDTFLGLDCNLDEFSHQINRFFETIEHDDLVLFYFAGHSKHNGDENYLLPSNYEYNYRTDEHDYMIQYAINIKYIMKKVYDRQCRISIYLFDCCRYVRRTRLISRNEGLVPIIPQLKSLIVFSCTPGKSILEETQNNRNGCFMENLLKYILMPNKDIEEIIMNIIDNVNLQTDGLQLPHRISSLTNKVYFITNNNQEKVICSMNIHKNTKWKQYGTTIAGGNGQGSELHQLSLPVSICIDNNNQAIYVADCYNCRIMEFKCGTTNGQVVAGGYGYGNRIDQLNRPSDVIIDRKNDSLIISDQENKRIVRYSRRNNIHQQIVISNIDCGGLAMDNNEDLYISNWKKNEVRRWKQGDKKGTIVAGGNGKGNHLHQLDSPTYIFVDRDYSIYVSDTCNHRVMKWLNGAKQGIVVAGGQGQGDSLTQLYRPQGVIVDHMGNVYVADSGNNRIMRWCEGDKEGSIVLGGNGWGQQTNQFSGTVNLSFDKKGNLFVVDYYNHRIQRFEMDID